ncbi:MAG: peptidylprolyl isomerase [Verrucomicrobiota bacterium]
MRIFINLSLAALLIFVIIGCGNNSKTVALVAGKKITQEELDQETDVYIASRNQSEEEMSAAERVILQWDVLNGLIIRDLVKEFVDSGIKDLDQDALKKKSDEIFAEIKMNFEDESSFIDKMAAEGMTIEELKEQIYTKNAFDALVMLRKAEEIKVTTEDAKVFYDENPQYFKQPERILARHILMLTNQPDMTTEQKAVIKKKMETARQRIIQGEDFANVAQEVSEDPGSKDKGGMLPLFERGQMVKEFEEVSFNSEPGKISQVFETSYGYHFLEVKEKHEAGLTDFKTVESHLISSLEARKQDAASTEMIDELKKKGEFEIFIENPNPEIVEKAE